MMRLRIPTPLTSRFGSDNRGAAAVEFALLLPIILFLYVCVIEFCQAFMVQRRVSHATSQIADIVAQTGEVNKATLNGYFDISQLIMSPFDGTPMRSKVTSVVRDRNGRAIVQWSYARGMSADSRGSVKQIPANLMDAEGEALIISESIFSYDSPYDIEIPGFPNYLANLTTFSRQFYLRPREVVSVSCRDC